MRSSSYLWTELGARLKLVRTGAGENLHWVFLPGGPGLGSEALAPLTSLLTLPGTLWHLDLPGDDSNLKGSFKNWKPALLEAVTALENVILVGHSKGGMLALATPELQRCLKGLILLDTTPDMSWREQFARRVLHFPLSQETKVEMKKLEAAYRKKPSNNSIMKLTVAGASFMFRKENLEKGVKFLRDLPYNYKAFQWTEAHFDPTYKARWIPKIPTLILAGEDDMATPLQLFQKKEYQRSNILMREIKNAGHFPWMENPADVVAAFNEYNQISFQKSDPLHRPGPE
jgi:pimeloyl-ACP methyl ester carboxylesterase